MPEVCYVVDVVDGVWGVSLNDTADDFFAGANCPRFSGGPAAAR